MLKTVFIILLGLLEIPFLVKCLNAHKNCELTREIAIIIIMLIIALIILGIFMLG